ncbi:pyruvate dehydrogenase E2 component (dihydrolipoamide acetyltransferase) [Caldicoprobacter guelmensis]|uniref:dihydrolipoamide acetyltransferase family protein n=1 Tax=Caldicoprobacter guelmensis TaxID=1170224 RepID=UPI001959D251|nr:dihydrolipoamide acetyltransferase family protein [Caldicoprobacter guelmensis]MBM7582032.1 pyruvate dehydrogenase E2 component (dihydrolipoamide acetyltransferase) [Caldicoprobacter guelmensis]
MATPVIMPRQGQTVESCVITKWYKKKGDTVKVGDLLFSYETDKAAFDEEAKAEGTLLEIFFDEGDDVPVLATVCVIGEEGEDISEFMPGGKKVPTTQGGVVEGEQQSGADNEKKEKIKGGTVTQEDGRIKISPRARNLAEKVGVDYREATPTGPNGRIIERDIRQLIEDDKLVTPAAREAYLKAEEVHISGTGIGGRVTTADVERMKEDKSREMVQPRIQERVAEAEYEEVKLSNIRKVIARTMHQSLANTAQLTIHTSFDATEILAFRNKVKEQGGRLGLENITLNDIILYVVSRTLLNHKVLNAHFLEDKMLIFKHVHLGVAVDTERGLMVPTIYNADGKSLNQISREVKELVEACRKGSINPDYLKGGTFTVTNLGTLGVEAFTPILNPPQTGILGVNTIVQRVKEVDGKIVTYPAMGLSLTFDHRAVDGAPAARFLQELKTNLENFDIFLAK